MDGIDLIENQIDKLVELVALTSLWASPIIVQELFKEENNPTASWYNNSRRYRKKNGEMPKTLKDGIWLDDNSKANNAIKAALGFTKRPTHFATCHIYESSTYDCKYHTSIPNLVLVPTPIYSLTDHLKECMQFLKYYSYTQYGFYIDQKPVKPEFWENISLKAMLAPTDEQIKKALVSVKKRRRKI
jgi:hypothetical protein